MFQLLRRGFGFDLALFLVLSLLVSAGAAAGAALAIDAAFGDAVSHLIGQAGEYDLIVHLREDSTQGSLPVLTQLLEDRWPGVRVRRSVRVAGNDNVLITFPPQHRRGEVFESLPSLLGEITGYNGHTWVVEPSLTISGVRPAVAERLQSQLAAIPGVDFSFRHGSRLTVVLKDAASTESVGKAIEDLLARYQVAEIRLPEGVDGKGVAQALWSVLPARERERWVDITGGGAPGTGTEALLLDLAQILDLYAARAYFNPEAGLDVGQRVLLQGRGARPLQPGDVFPEGIGDGYVVVEVTAAGPGHVLGRIVQGSAADLVEVGPGRFAEPGFLLEGRRVGAPVGTVTVESVRHAVEKAALEAESVVGRMEELAARMETVAGATVETLSQWLQALLQLEEVQQQLQGVQVLLNGGDGAAPRQALVTMLLGLLAREGEIPLGDVLAQLGAEGQAGGEAGSPSTGSLQWIQGELDALRRQAEALAGDGVQQLADGVGRLKDHLPALSDAALADTLRRLDAYTGEKGWSAALEVLMPAGVSADTIASYVHEAVAITPRVALFEAGILNPNPRASLLQVLVQVRQTLAGVIAIGLAAFILWADGGTLLHAGRLLQALPGSSRRRGGRRGAEGLPRSSRVAGARGLVQALWGAVLGAVLVTGIYHLAGGAIPGLRLEYLLSLGLGMGVLTALLAERISPVNEDEVVAAAACGLTPADIMREVVIPEGRPGFLMLVFRLRGRMR